MFQTYIIMIRKLPVRITPVLWAYLKGIAFFSPGSPRLFGLMDIECVRIFLLRPTHLHFAISAFHVNEGDSVRFLKLKTFKLTAWNQRLILFVFPSSIYFALLAFFVLFWCPSYLALLWWFPSQASWQNKFFLPLNCQESPFFFSSTCAHADTRTFGPL